MLEGKGPVSGLQRNRWVRVLFGAARPKALTMSENSKGGSFAVTSSDRAWGALFRQGSMRQILTSQSFAAGLLTEDAQLSQQRNDLPITLRDTQYDAWPAGYRIIDSSITFTRGERLLAMVKAVLNFDVTAWLRGK